jgi:hypothetical protein
VSTPYQVQAGNLLYTVVDDCTTIYWAVLTGAVTDEILGEFYSPNFTVEVARPDLGTKTTANGLFAVTAYPDRSFPQLATTSYTVNLVLRAPGFRDFNVAATIPVNATFPVVIPPVAMRRLPVRIQGRVVNDVTRAPVAGASVFSVDDPMTPPLVHTTALRSPLYFAHATGVSAQLVTIASMGGATLTADSAVGAHVLDLSTRAGLGPGSILQLSNMSKLIVEYAVVDHLGTGPAAGPGEVFLRNAMNRSYPAGLPTTVRFVSAMLVGAPATLSVDADAGDGVLRATQLLNGATLAVEPGTLSEEYHEVGALTDPDGYYGLDGIGRVQEIFLKASQGALQQTQGWFIEYDHAINVADFRIS